MRIARTGPGAFLVEFESEADLQAEVRANLAAGGLLLESAEALAPDTPIALALRLVGGGQVAVAARVVAALAGALAVQVDGNPPEIVRALLEAAPGTDEDESSAPGTTWDRLRRLTPPQRVLLAPRADRATRTLLVQDSDPQVLLALLKNPGLTLDEVVRVAKSSFLSFQAADLILKTNAWTANLEVRVALIHNPKLPLPFALRILATLPDKEVRTISKGAATSMPLKQAALKRLQGG